MYRIREVHPDESLAEYYAADNLLHSHSTIHDGSLFVDRRDFGSMHVVVAQTGEGEVVAAGTLLGEIRKIDEVAVLPGHREQGIGREVVRMLEVLAKEEGIRDLELYLDVPEASGFFKKLGYTPDDLGTLFYKAL